MCEERGSVKPEVSDDLNVIGDSESVSTSGLMARGERESVGRLSDRLQESVASKDGQGDAELLVVDVLHEFLGYSDGEVSKKDVPRGSNQTAARAYVAEPSPMSSLIFCVEESGKKLKNTDFKHFSKFAVDNNIEWLIMTNGGVWKVHRIDRGEVKPAFTASATPVGSGLEEFERRLRYISKNSVQDQTLHRYAAAISSKSLKAVILDDSVLDAIRTSLEGSSGLKFEDSEIKSIANEFIAEKVSDSKVGFRTASDTESIFLFQRHCDLLRQNLAFKEYLESVASSLFSVSSSSPDQHDRIFADQGQTYALATLARPLFLTNEPTNIGSVAKVCQKIYIGNDKPMMVTALSEIVRSYNALNKREMLSSTKMFSFLARGDLFDHTSDLEAIKNMFYSEVMHVDMDRVETMEGMTFDDRVQYMNIMRRAIGPYCELAMRLSKIIEVAQNQAALPTRVPSRLEDGGTRTINMWDMFPTSTP